MGLKKINVFDLSKKTLTIFFTIFIISIFISAISLFFGVNDLNFVSEKIIDIPFYVIVYLFIVRVFLEELFFRAFLVKRIGMFFASIFFALGHVFYGSVIEVLGAFILGFVLCYFYKKYNNIWPNYLAHLLYNLLSYTFLVLAS